MRWTEYRGRGFFCRDGLLEVWLALVVDELDRRPPESEARWMSRLRDDFRTQATVAFDGIMETRLDPHLAGESQRRLLASLFEQLGARLARGERPEGPLAERVGGERWARRETLDGLSRIAGAFLWLLDPLPPASP
jgi:hypothetical protein